MAHYAGRIFSRLNNALKRCSAEELQRLTVMKGFTEVETTALQYAHAALNVTDEQAAHALFDKWLELDLVERARTQREIVLVEYAEVCIECAF